MILTAFFMMVRNPIIFSMSIFYFPVKWSAHDDL